MLNKLLLCCNSWARLNNSYIIIIKNLSETINIPSSMLFDQLFHFRLILSSWRSFNQQWELPERIKWFLLFLLFLFLLLLLLFELSIKSETKDHFCENLIIRNNLLFVSFVLPAFRTFIILFSESSIVYLSCFQAVYVKMFPWW